MTKVLVAAALYNACFGVLAGLAPKMTLTWLGFLDPSSREQALWQCIGMIVGVYGVAYWFAARAPLRHWPVVLAGLLGKLFGPIGFVSSAANGVMPWRTGFIILSNDIVWWIPFSLILIASARVHKRIAE